MSDEEEKRPAFLSSYLKTSMPYFTTILLLLVNLIALSISLNCNKDQNLFVRIMLAIFSFIFSIPYLIIHFIRIVVFNKEICKQNHIKFFI